MRSSGPPVGPRPGEVSAPATSTSLNSEDQIDEEIKVLLAVTDGQILTSLPGVAVIRAAAFDAHSLPIARFPDAEHLYSATGLAPALYESATLRRRGRISLRAWPNTATRSWASLGDSPCSHPASLNAPPNSAPVGWPRSGQRRTRPQRLPPHLPAAGEPATLR